MLNLSECFEIPSDYIMIVCPVLFRVKGICSYMASVMSVILTPVASLEELQDTSPCRWLMSFTLNLASAPIRLSVEVELSQTHPDILNIVS